MASKKSRHLLLFFVQIIITLLYSSAIIHMAIIMIIDKDSGFLLRILRYLPSWTLFIVALVPQIILRLKKRIYSQDGDIYPTLFAVLSLQTSLIIPEFTAVTGIYLLDPAMLVIIERFSILATATLFLFSALRFYGFSSANMSLVLLLIIGSTLILSILAPMNTNQTGSAFSSRFDALFALATLLLYIATILTMIISAIKDKTNTNIKRSASFILLIAGLYVADAPILILSLSSIALYIAGIVLLIQSTRESF